MVQLVWGENIPDALNGQEVSDGVEIARQIANERGGVNGKEIVFAQADAPDATAATQEADRLITEEGVTCIMGTQSSSLSIAASAVAERSNVFYWELEGISDQITGRGFKYLFRVTFSARQMAEAMLNFIEEVVPAAVGKPASEIKVALVHEDSGFGTSTAQNIETLAPGYSFTLVAKESYSAKSAELESMILNLKAKAPDVLLAASYINDSILLTRQSKELGFRPPVIIGTTAGHGTPGFVEALGADAEGICAAGIPSQVNADNMSAEFRELYDEIVERYEALRGKKPSVNVFNGFSGAWVLFTEVLPRAESMAADDLREAALSLELDEGETLLGYGVKFAGPDAPNAGHNLRALAAVMQWQDGVLQVIYPEVMATSEPEL